MLLPNVWITYSEKILPLYNYNYSLIFEYIKTSLNNVSNYYTNFNKWLCKVFYELHYNFRSIILSCVDNKIAGFSILKHKHGKNKICSFWVHPNYRHIGVGHNLLLHSMNFFSNNDPIITIPDFMRHQFSYFLSNDFYEINKINNLYNNGIAEYVYTIPLKIATHK